MSWSAPFCQTVHLFTDHQISGTSYISRPSIQALPARYGKQDIDTVLCVTVDRISREAEHGNGFLKRLKFEDIELWTVHGGNSRYRHRDEPARQLEPGVDRADQVPHTRRHGDRRSQRQGYHLPRLWL
ncbi:recombinase family protein [Agrobacterium sp. T29]|uniref:recombinase family protein n=1 Tax=Agrobacterium sp. T29 TaxID=2580515 RepID=UPI00143D5A8C|nr:recombinase family protein [Agrobacterium sp. T29]